LLAIAWLGIACSAACRAPKPPPPVPTPVPPLVTEDLPVPHWLELDIVNLVEQVSPDRSRVTVSGVLVNRGNRPTKRVDVRVEGLDATGRVLVSMEGVPSSQNLQSDGGTASFQAELPNDPGVDRYHVKALAQ
jgi:hypothetical protein